MVITPNFVPGTDLDKPEETPENTVTIHASDSTPPPGMIYLVFLKTPPSTVEYKGTFDGSASFSATCSDSSGQSEPQTLYLVPVPIERQIPIASGTAPWNLVEHNYTKALPGQKMNFRIQDKYLNSYVPGGASLGDCQWTVPDKVFKDYLPDSNNSHYSSLAAADLAPAKDVHFYWADSGDKEIQVNFQVLATGAAGTENAMATINVSKVKSVFGTRPGADQLAPSPGFPDERVFGYFGSNNGLPGITFVGAVATPADWSDGQWNWTQLIKSNRIYTNKSGTHTSIGDGLSFKLDLPYPYCPPGTSAFIANGSVQDGSQDTPQEPTRGRDRIEVHESFETYLLFKPPGLESRYVPLQKATWQWGGVVSSANGWQSVTLPEGRADATGVECSDHPQWSANTTEDVEH